MFPYWRKSARARSPTATLRCDDRISSNRNAPGVFDVTMTSVRQLHSYIGVFIAPSVLFFALTGAVQLFSLHEAHGNYRPPAIVEKLSSVHKDQVFAFGDHHDQPSPDDDAGKPAVGAAPPAGAKDDDKDELSTLILKGYFLMVALCLTVSTALGLWMGLTQTRQRRLAWLLAVAGALIPVGLLVF
jgi:hypothetical protein